MYLLDTNVISETSKARPHHNVRTWIESVPSESIRISVLSLGELRKGVEKLRPRNPERAAALDVWLTSVSRRYADAILGIDVATAELWGRLLGRMEAGGRQLPAIDGLLAAQAQRYGLTIVTRNVSDFAGTDVPILDPWSASG